MNPIGINKNNVGRIAERIVANELAYRGFRVSDLNKEGTSENADLLAAKDGETWQIQVKGSTATEKSGWWVNYGYCDPDIIDRKKPVFNNSRSAFYKAQIVVLVSVKSPTEYRCVVLPVKEAEKAAQLNLDYGFRTPRQDGSPHKPGKVWASLDYIPRTKDAERRRFFEAEQELLKPYRDNWDLPHA
jgi:hypothetical protein